MSTTRMMTSLHHVKRRRSVWVSVMVVFAVIASLAGLTKFLNRPEVGQDPRQVESTVSPNQAATTTQQPAFRYDLEYEAIGYSTTRPSGQIDELQQAIASGRLKLEFDPVRGYLDSLLRALDIDATSQLLVFSKTSLQNASIHPETPRAIYFNDETYVAWVQGGPLEIASMDPLLGQLFYTLEQQQDDAVTLDRRIGTCLRCHDSYSLTGGGVPRFILGSGYIGTDGELISHEGWILTNPRTPLRNRWGGWYVSGRHGDQQHLGNVIVEAAADLQQLDSLRIGNLDNLDSMLDADRYLTPYSDIAALMVVEHQVQIQNLITRVNYDTRTALFDEAKLNAELNRDPDEVSAATMQRIAGITEPLIQAMLMVDEVQLTSPIVGTSGFATQFEQRGPRDSRGRSLRELDLSERLFEYPLSYLIYSRAFDALPELNQDFVFSRLRQLLGSDDHSEGFEHLSAADRRAILEILDDTKPSFAAAIAD